MQFSFFEEDCGGCCSVVHADHYFLLSMETDTVQHTKLKKLKRAIWSKILSQKPASFLTTRKGERGRRPAEGCLHSMWSNTAPHFDKWIVFLHHRNGLWKKFPCSRTKYEWVVVNPLAPFAVLKAVEIRTMTNIGIIWWRVLSIWVWNSSRMLGENKLIIYQNSIRVFEKFDLTSKIIVFVEKTASQPLEVLA